MDQVEIAKGSLQQEDTREEEEPTKRTATAMK